MKVFKTFVIISLFSGFILFKSYHKLIVSNGEKSLLFLTSLLSLNVIKRVMRVKSLSSFEDGASVQAHQDPPLLHGDPPCRSSPEARRINSRSEGETTVFVLDFSKGFKQIENQQQFTFSPSSPSSPGSPGSPNSPCLHKKVIEF